MSTKPQADVGAILQKIGFELQSDNAPGGVENYRASEDTLKSLKDAVIAVDTDGQVTVHQIKFL